MLSWSSGCCKDPSGFRLSLYLGVTTEEHALFKSHALPDAAYPGGIQTQLMMLVPKRKAWYKCRTWTVAYQWSREPNESRWLQREGNALISNSTTQMTSNLKTDIKFVVKNLTPSNFHVCTKKYPKQQNTEPVRLNPDQTNKLYITGATLNWLSSESVWLMK